MLDFLFTYFQNEYILLVVCIALLAFLHAHKYHSETTGWLHIGTCLILLLSFCGELDDWCRSQPASELIWFVRQTASILGYSLRSAVILILIMQIRHRVDNLMKGMLVIYAILNVLMILSYFGINVVSMIEHINHWVAGPLLFLTAIVPAIYIVALLYTVAVRFKYENNVFEMFVLSYCAFTTLLGGVLEMIDVLDDVLTILIAVDYVVCYMFIFSKHASYDALTGLLNRAEFYRDLARRGSAVTAVISVDMNGLKTINDTEGHDAGDLAIKTVAEVLALAKRQSASVYRMGGDEFVILYFQTVEDGAEKLVETLKENLAKTKYSCAFGVGVVKNGVTLEEIVKRSDARMYEDKRRMKQEKEGSAL